MSQSFANLVQHYLDHYPNGRGGRRLSLRLAGKMTRLPHTMIHRIVTGEIGPGYRSMLKNLNLLSAGLGIPYEKLEEAIMLGEDDEKG